MAKRKSKPTSKRRSELQRIKDRYAHAREDAQLSGLIPTTPEESLKPERVETFGHAYEGLPELVKQAIRESWATPDKAKPAIIAALLEPFFKTQTIIDIDGKEVQVKPSPALLMSLANTLRMLDVVQYERDNPELAAKLKGQINNSVNVNNTNNNSAASVVQTNQEAVRVLNEMIDEPNRGIEDCTVPNQSSTSGNS